MGPQKLPPLREVRFGDLDATQEAALEPELLLTGYFDFREAAYSIASCGAWLLLGPKGAGKSAVLEHLKLEWENRYDRFMTHWQLDTFPIQDVTKIDVGQGEGGQRAQAAWEFLLLLRLCESIDGDAGRGYSADFENTLTQLRRAGYIGADVQTLVRRLARTSVSVDFKLLKGEAQWDQKAAGLPELTRAIRASLSSLRLSSQHLVALDGLDQFFFEGGSGWESLSGLIDAIASVNRLLMGLHLPASVVATLRSDHFDALNSQNSNKLKSYTVYLDWSAGGIGAQNNLWALVSKKAAVSRPEVTDVVRQYLASQMDKPAFPSVAEFLLSYTRLLPRDMIAMMGYVQAEHPGSAQVNEREAVAAASRYSEEYFVGEIMNNLSGVLKGSEAHKIASFRDALRSAPSRLFSFDYLRSELEGELEPAQIKELLRRMFETGGVGVSNPLGSGGRYTDFIFRRVSGAAFTHRYDFLLHDALTRAWHRPWF